jgi:hypothetical protein
MSADSTPISAAHLTTSYPLSSPSLTLASSWTISHVSRNFRLRQHHLSFIDGIVYSAERKSSPSPRSPISHLQLKRMLRPRAFR